MAGSTFLIYCNSASATELRFRTGIAGEVSVNLGSGDDYLSTFGLNSPYAFFDGGPSRGVLNQRANQFGDSDIVNFEVPIR